MPHFILDCSEDILDQLSQESIIDQIHQVAHASGLFDEQDIKVRVNPYRIYLVGGGKAPFIHVFSHIMQGRSTEQKAALSQSIVRTLMSMFPEVPNIAMNVSEFEKATYVNRKML
ncbi:5-carboxymethyl-2-hydroxymuconate Delta-isomerase [Hahella ganghwensis]|uniref:5-carboxymethyl-2-hydroxymuconate Delta-isomerase n=1 Tax=Hahella ganghwensis TaxID=286420 RepID=UPI0003671A0D|nr:5-carboxymethyl-2-hydroxymuconate Delta-isomerase [Hahella ganghwensis]